MRSRILLAAVPFVAAGCVAATTTYLGPRERLAPVHDDSVHVYLPTDSVPPSCHRYAIISLEGDLLLASDAAMREAAVHRAGKIGANAVQLTELRDPKAGRVIAGAVIGVNANRKGAALAFTCSEPRTSWWGRIMEALGLGD